jgi:TetR/AcrR family transcriptional regulator of autoinduction and epiphytic fitness
VNSHRSYDNRRRAAKAADTRARIVDAAVSLLSDGAEELTVPVIAARAGVSVPTVYRNFASREELFAAVDAVLVQTLGVPTAVSAPEALPEVVRSLYAGFGTDVERLRASARRPAFAEVRSAGRRVRDRELAQAMAPLTDTMSAEDAQAFVGLLRILVGTEAFLVLHDRFGLTPDAAGRACAWAVTQLCAAAARGSAPSEDP